MFSHPTFVARNVGSDAQAETLLAKQRIAAVPGAVRPNFPSFREMHDVFFFIARPGHIFLAVSERNSDLVHAGHDARDPRVDLLKHRQPDACHDAHVDEHIRRIGQLYADLRHGRTKRAHAIA